MPTITNLLGYQITEQLYAGTRTLVYRAIRTSDKYPVVIKVLRNEYPNFHELIGFRNQYTIAKNLDLPSIIKPLSLEVYHNSYALVMEDFGGISLSTYLETATDKNQLSQYLSLTEFLNLAIQLSEILDYLYQSRVIHKDIKPANILINPETKQVKLIDFSIASLLPRETQEIQNANSLEGTLAYLSPEQTGRMNRGIDYRSDFYALGITFYELLTGELPFVSDEPMELVHCHLAKNPRSVHQINPDIPLVLSEIISKLMAKNAENRYQSALGIKHDLEICLEQLQATGSIENFAIGQRDLSNRFLIPEKLYGRETEVQTLLEAFDRVATPLSSPLSKGGQRGVEIMLVAGFSGIGKTAVVNEVHKPIARQRGYFIKGKYDQFQRNIPFSAFVQAFRDLMGQLLSESDAQLQTWKTKILEAVGDSGQVLIDVIPELERIIGKQSPATELSGSAAQNRFNLLMQKFVKIFTSIEHPLVMFIDDLQWADSASLNLLQLLMQDSQYLLILGAYRDNEVSAAHPFILTVNEIVKTGAVVNTITLQPLSLLALNQLVADTLNCDLYLAQPLTELVCQKTQGNPFFATQFLKALYEDGQIKFYPPQSPLAKGGREGGWQCDITQVRALAITEDVVEFMALQLQKLPLKTQEVLKLAACIGAQFDLNTLAIVSEKSPEATADNLWKALQEGLIIPNTQIYKFFTQSDTASVSDAAANPIYRFLHDRVQQAAYSLIPEQQKIVTHLKIGQLLQQNSSEIEQEEKLFDIVGHLNRGIELITQPIERGKLAQLNLKAGSKARSSTAYAAARIYLERGIELLTDNSWQSQYELTLNLYVAATEAAYLNGDFEGMEDLAALVLQQAQTILDKVKIYEISIAARSAKCQMLEALAIGRNALSQLGVELPAEPDEALIGKALQAVGDQLSGRGIEALVDLPVMTNPKATAAMQLLAMLFSPILQGMPGLMPLLSSTMVSLSIEFGNAPASSVGYVIHGLVSCAFLGKVETGYSFGKLALTLLDRFNARKFKCLILNLFGGFIQHRQEPLLAIIPTLKDAYTAGMETGNFLNAGYSMVVYFDVNFLRGVELNTWEHEIAGYNAALAQVKQYPVRAYFDIKQQVVQNLRETVSQPDCLIGIAYDETVRIPQHHQEHDLSVIAVVYIQKLVLAYIFGNYKAAIDYIAQADRYVTAISGMVFVPVFHFYAALTHLAFFPSHPESEQSEMLAVAVTHQMILQHWAHHAPMNHQHKVDLIEAEKCRVLGQKAEAIEFYDKAISGAKVNEYIQEEALANELAAKFYLNWGKEKVAADYMQEAYYCYARWGAKAKVVDLETRYPPLLQPILNQPKTSVDTLATITSITHSSTQVSSSSISDTLDFASVIKAAQALSSTIQLDELLKQLVQIILQNSGADNCILVLPQNKTWQVKAISTLETTELCSEPLDNCLNVPIKLIQYVKRTQAVVIVDNLETDLPIIDDYLIQQQPKSILCLPILNQGNLTAILYLKNQSTAGVFTNSRLQILNVLCTQAAISLENATLYNTLEQKVSDRTQELSQTLEYLRSTQKKLIESEKMAALGGLVAGVAHEINTPLGTSVTAASLLAAKTQDFVNAIASGAIKRSILSEYVDIAAETSQLILSNLQRAGNLVQSFKQVAVDQTHLECRTFLVKDYVEDILFALQPTLKQTPHTVTVNGDENLQITSYPGALSQIITNLIANSIAHAYPSGTSGQLQLNISQQGEQIAITYQDDGCGILPEHLDKIFDPFFTTARNRGGTGLGLHIVYNLVTQKLSGQLDVQSQSDRGTMFTLLLPKVVLTVENA